jgi:hypothetical protein
MTILRNLLMTSARRLAADPRVRQKAAKVFSDEVRPKLDAARDELRDIAGDTDPRKDPKAFARKLKNRFLDINRDD